MSDLLPWSKLKEVPSIGNFCSKTRDIVKQGPTRPVGTFSCSTDTKRKAGWVVMVQLTISVSSNSGPLPTHLPRNTHTVVGNTRTSQSCGLEAPSQRDEGVPSPKLVLLSYLSLVREQSVSYRPTGKGSVKWRALKSKEGH